jgi:hypothetical protein
MVEASLQRLLRSPSLTLRNQLEPLLTTRRPRSWLHFFQPSTLDVQRQAERLFRISEKRAERLSTEAVRFIAAAQYVAGQLQADPQLEWSPTVIGLCKAVEAEIVWRILRPPADRTSREDLSTDKNDRDLGRVAAFCADPTRKPPATIYRSSGCQLASEN